MPLTSDLFIQPFESSPGQFLLGCAIGKGVADGDIFKELEDSTLHCQLVKISIQEGYDSFWERRRAVEVHSGGTINQSTRTRADSVQKAVSNRWLSCALRAFYASSQMWMRGLFLMQKVVLEL